MPELRCDRIVKVFPGGAPALRDVSFEVQSGSVVTLLGPSGCGKSTLLRIVAGLETPTSGEVRLDGRSLEGVPPGERDVGFVFQSYALYPHLTVERNLSLALEVKRLPAAEIRGRVTGVARMLEIEPLLSRRPGEISGGQQQRVAVARALVRRPSIYLMDEPLSNLDVLLRESTRTELKALFRRLGATVLYVTHDQVEAMALSDRVAVLREGRLLQFGTPAEVYGTPGDTFTAQFVGSPRMAILSGRAEGGAFVARGVRLPLPTGLQDEGTRELQAGIRAEDLEVSLEPSPGSLEARVELQEPLGERCLVTLRAGEETLRAFAPAPIEASSCHARPRPERIHFFDTSGRRLPAGRGLG